MYHEGSHICNVKFDASMDIERENTEMLLLFLQLFNEVLQEVSGNPLYRFNPHGIMVGKNGGNINAVRDVLGDNQVLKIVTCQWHFKECTWKQVCNINRDKQETFKDLYEGLCYAAMQHEYQCVSEALQNLCQWNNIIQWFDWWDARKYHIVPAFRGYNVPRLNLAEVGHSTMARQGKRVKLMVAMMKDIMTMIKQDSDYTDFLENIRTRIGRGPTQVDERVRERQYDRHMVE